MIKLNRDLDDYRINNFKYLYCTKRSPLSSKYNGKEVQTVGGLGFTDYGARMYDDFTGRWFVPDPLAEETVWSSPFSFNQNNPINRIDLTGRKDNPVYDTYGNFLGTNDLGL